MEDLAAAGARDGSGSFPAEVYLPFDSAHPAAGTVAVTGAALVVTARGERFDIAPGSTRFSLGGHNAARLIVEGAVGGVSPRAG